jgi:hypothetical protein
MSTIYREPSENASYQIAIHLPKRFQRSRFFRNQPIKNGQQIGYSGYRYYLLYIECVLK